VRLGKTRVPRRLGRHLEGQATGRIFASRGATRRPRAFFGVLPPSGVRPSRLVVRLRRPSFDARASEQPPRDAAPGPARRRNGPA